MSAYESEKVCRGNKASREDKKAKEEEDDYNDVEESIEPKSDLKTNAGERSSPAAGLQ